MNNYLKIILVTFSTLLFFSLLPASAEENFDDKLSQTIPNQSEITAKSKQQKVMQWVRTIKPAAGPSLPDINSRAPYWQQTVSRSRSRSRSRTLRE